MRIPVIKASDAVTKDGITISERAKQFARRFCDAFEFDGDESEIADRVYAVHLELAGDHETYIEVAEVLGPTLKRALHTYVSMKWRER